MLQKIQALDGITAVHTARCEDVTLSFDAALYQPIMENNGYGSSLEDLEKFFTESPENFATTVITISERDLKTYNQNAAVPVDVKAFWMAGSAFSVLSAQRNRQNRCRAKRLLCRTNTAAVRFLWKWAAVH